MKFYKKLVIKRDEYGRIVYARSPVFTNHFYFPSSDDGKIVLTSDKVPDENNSAGIYVASNIRDLNFYSGEVCEIVPAPRSKVIIHERGARLEKGIITKINGDTFFVNTSFDLSQIETPYGIIHINGNLTAVKVKTIRRLCSNFVSVRNYGIISYKNIVKQDDNFIVLESAVSYECVRYHGKVICMYDEDGNILYTDEINELFPEIKTTKLPCKSFKYNHLEDVVEIYGAKFSDFDKIRDNLSAFCIFLDSEA